MIWPRPGISSKHAKAVLTLHVTDLDIALSWYSSVFGVEPVHRGIDVDVAGASTSYAVFVLAGMKVFLSDARGPDAGRRQEHHPPTVVFMTHRPLSELRHLLESRGAHFRDDEVVDGFPTDADGVRTGQSAAFLWFNDPHGNKLAFCRVLVGLDTNAVFERNTLAGA